MPPENTYDTKKIIIFGVIILIIVAIIGFFIFRKVTGPGAAENQKNLFPYDGSITPPSTSSGTGTAPIENPITETPITSTTSERLRIIANYHVTAMYPFLQNVISSEPKLDEKTNRTVMITKSIPTNYLRFNAKQNGFLVDAEVTKNIISITQKTNTPVPNSEEVWFGNKGNAVTYRSWDSTKRTIATFSGSIPSPSTINYCQKPLKVVLGTKSKGDEVRELQKYINIKLSLNLTIDGVYGKKIANTIKPLEKILAIPEDGKYSQTLIDAINTDCANITATLNQQMKGIQKFTGDFIDSGILRGDVSPDGTQLFFLKPTPSGVAGIVSDITGKHERQIFTSPLTEWKPQWVNTTTIAMTTLASSEADGYLYFLNPITGNFQKVLGPLRGLTTLVNPSATTILVGQSIKKGISLSTYNIATGDFTTRDLTTLPAKCTWQNDSIAYCAIPQTISSGQYPDDWYQGNTIFNDAFWSIDVIQNSTTNIVSPTQKFDAYNLVVSPDGAYLYFINKIDGSLWSYRMESDQ